MNSNLALQDASQENADLRKENAELLQKARATLCAWCAREFDRDDRAGILGHIDSCEARKQAFEADAAAAWKENDQLRAEVECMAKVQGGLFVERDSLKAERDYLLDELRLLRRGP